MAKYSMIANLMHWPYKPKKLDEVFQLLLSISTKLLVEQTMHMIAPFSRKFSNT